MGTHLQTKYQKLAGRRGKKRAIVAVGHTILRIVYHILKDWTTYKELGGDYVDSRQKQSQIKYHQNALIKLGVDMPEKQNTG